jgi:hypothetical protein
VLPNVKWYKEYYQEAVRTDEELHPNMLLINAVGRRHPARHRLIDMLLQRWVPLETVCETTGETALITAVGMNDVEVRMRG